MSNTATATYERDTTFDEVIKHIKFGITLISASLYAAEKILRLPVILAEIAGVPDEAADKALEKLRWYADVFKYASFGIMAFEFFDPLLRGKSKFLWIDLEESSFQNRKLIIGIAVCCTVVFIGGVAYTYWGKVLDAKAFISKKTTAWKKLISVIIGVFTTLYGVVQVITIIQNWDKYKNEKLQSISSAIVYLSAPLEMYGIDKVIYLSDGGEGIAYGIVYGVRTAVKFCQAIGIHTKD